MPQARFGCVGQIFVRLVLYFFVAWVKYKVRKSYFMLFCMFYFVSLGNQVLSEKKEIKYIMYGCQSELD